MLCIQPHLIGQNVLPDNIVSSDCSTEVEAMSWGVTNAWSSSTIVSNLNIPLVGDLDGDGHPEIVCFSLAGQSHYMNDGYNGNVGYEMLVFDGVSHQLKATVTMDSPVSEYDAASYGLVRTSDGKGLIVVASCDNRLRAYDITSANPNTPYWVSDADYTSGTNNYAANVSFVDFNGDGHPEVYVRNKVYNAENGKLLAEAATTNTGASYAHYTQFTHRKLSSPFAADVCGDSRPELILGNEIYDVSITNLNGTAGNTITLAQQVTPPGGAPVDGNVQVADFNMDGYLDVLITIKNTEGQSGAVYCYVWDVHNGQVGNPLSININRSGKSIPLIADIDNDGMLEMVLQCGASTNRQIQAYKYNSGTQTFSLMWDMIPDEDTFSNSFTAFDFNQDGLLELIICDQSTLKIVNGSGKSHLTHNDTVPMYVLNTFSYSETTIMQYPVIADVDADGSAEIVSVGSSKLNILKSSGQPWAPARPVWNQYLYNVTNINKDLTVPSSLFNNATEFTDPDGVVRRPFNNFLQQATTLDQYGRPFMALANATAIPGYITYEDSVYTLTYQLCNTGGQTLFPPIPCSFYAEEYGGAYLGMSVYNNVVEPGDCVTCTMTFTEDFLSAHSAYPDVDSIVLVVNANQQGIAQNGGLQMECDTTDNVVVMPFVICPRTTVTVDICAGESYSDGNFAIPSSETWDAGTFYYSRVFEGEDCDSIVVLVLRVHPEYDMQFTETILSGMSYDNHGIYLSASMLEGEDLIDTTVTYQSVYGCDSVVRVTIQIVSSNTLPDNMVEADCTTDVVQQPWDAHVLMSANDIHNYFVPLVGDIDGNGIVEIVAGKAVSNDHFTTQVGIYRGTDLQQIGTINIPQKIYAVFGGPMALARYPDGNGGMQGAVILHCYDNKLRSYDVHGNLLATSDVNTPCEGVVSVTDFNYDGWPEVYIGNAIYDAATLKRLCAGNPNGNMGRCWRGDYAESARIALSFAADVLGDSLPELICGNTIYNVNILSRTDISLNNISEIKTVTTPPQIPQDGNVAVADFNMDGQLDVLVVVDGTPINTDDSAFIYAFDPVSENLFFVHSKFSKTIGFPLIGDIDGDGFLEFVYIDFQNHLSDSRITAMKYNPSIGLLNKWEATHSDVSGQTSMTLFDFNQDGIMEIVYRDEQNLRIINGSGISHKTGNDTIPFYNLYTKSMSAGTGKEYPVVADVNGDGAAEIVTCGKVNSGLGWVGGQLWVIGGIHPWAPARPVWNQYMYNVTNINKDLTVPMPLFDNATVFTDPQGVVRRPFNNFLQQATTLDQYGRPFAELANLSISGEPYVEFEGDAVFVEMEVCNTGETALLPPMSVSVYTVSGELVQTEVLAQGLLPNECVTIALSISQEMMRQFDNPYPLRIAVNDNGEGTAQYGGLQPECDTTDNFTHIDGRPCQMTVPNVITPNGDGINDVFEPQLEGEFVSMGMEIFDRWGKRVYRQESKELLRWDATGMSDGVYFCTIEYHCRMNSNQKRSTHTSITVVR